MQNTSSTKKTKSYLTELLVLFLLISALPGFAKNPIGAQRLIKCRPLFHMLSTGVLNKKFKDYPSLIATTKEEVAGLEVGGILPWQPKEINELNRRLVRYHNVTKFADPIPSFNKAQKLGPAIVKADDIRFSQLGCMNESGAYTVIGNAHALKNGTLKVNDLPKLRVWRDVDGRIWTLDHRRLAAMKLSGVVDDLAVEFVDEATVKTQRFKFDTKTMGESIVVRVEKSGEQPIAVLVMSDRLKKAVKASPLDSPIRSTASKADEATFRKLFSRYSKADRDLWMKGRGKEHFDKIKDYAYELSQSFKALESSAVGAFEAPYLPYGGITGRGKAEGSILAKLMRKDFNAFKEGQSGITDLKKAVNSLGDGIGVRLTLRANAKGAIDPKDVQGFVDQLAKEIKEGLRVSEIMNYRAAGENGIPYLSEEQVKHIVRADQDYRSKIKKMIENGSDLKIPEPIIVKTGPQASFETGYTSFHMNIMHKSGIQSEMQLRGPLMNDASEIQHLVYDLKSGKVLGEKLSKNPEIVSAAEAYNKLNSENKKRLIEYIERKLIHSRQIEAGVAASPTSSSTR